MNTTQKLFYGSIASLATIHSVAAQTSGGLKFGGDKVKADIKGTEETAENAIQILIGRAALFLGIVAVCYAIYGGFLILTAGTDDGKIKEGKNAIFHALLGIIVIWLANSIVQFVLKQILS